MSGTDLGGRYSALLQLGRLDLGSREEAERLREYAEPKVLDGLGAYWHDGMITWQTRVVEVEGTVVRIADLEPKDAIFLHMS